MTFLIFPGGREGGGGLPVSIFQIIGSRNFPTFWPPPYTYLLNGYFASLEMPPGLKTLEFGTRIFEMVSTIYISFCIGS